MYYNDDDGTVSYLAPKTLLPSICTAVLGLTSFYDNQFSRTYKYTDTL
jgi:hypothetical protein